VAQETVLLVCFEKRELDVLLSTLKYVISQAEEDLLWSSEVMGLHSLKALFHTIFFLNGKTLCLRGGHEHKNLKISQFSVWVVEILCIM
jgi:hypothetical protein